MIYFLKDKDKLERARVMAEVACPYRLCGARPDHPCLGKRGPREQLHQARWLAWAKRYKHLIKAVVPEDGKALPKPVRAEVERRLGVQTERTPQPDGGWLVRQVGEYVWAEPLSRTFSMTYPDDCLAEQPDWSYLLEP